AEPQIARAVFGDRVVLGQAGAPRVARDRSVLEAADAAERAHPEGPLRILEDGGREVVRQAVLDRVDAEASLAQLAEAAIHRADPDVSLRILIKREHGIARQS